MERIAHIVSSLNVGGAEKFVKNISIEQLKKGNNVVIVSFGKPSDDFQPIIQQHGIEVHNLAGGILSRLVQFVRIFLNIEIIHIHSPAVIRALLPIFPIMLLKKVIYTIHGEVDPPQKLIKLSHKAALLYLNAVVAVSESAKKSVEKRYDWKTGPITLIKNGVNVVKCVKGNDSEKGIRLGVVSRLIPLKNIPMLFKALSQLSKNDSEQFSIQIFGDGSEKNNLQQIASKLQNDGMKIEFHGNVINESDIYSVFDILVMCSDTEGLPMSILEAMGYGLPVISTNVGAIPEVISHEKNGWLYNVKDTEGLQKILENIVSSPQVIYKFGSLAKKYIDENYAISLIYHDYNKVYAG
ncbi:glycosyltransferase [Colwellia sp. KU-HH00111]|uniref:glycosyltransferase family 4 protein n=1 Tax=Colwellia sp. KU-HH00111 TaxID=3127652 RepID=UPI00310B7911